VLPIACACLRRTMPCGPGAETDPRLVYSGAAAATKGEPCLLSESR
jgi:hypothetical protein